MKLVLLALYLGLVGCNSPQSHAIKACEIFIKERLRSPSTYKKVRNDSIGPVFVSEGRNVKMINIEYDAANAFGTPIRGSQQCMFQVDKGGKFSDDIEFAAKMASIGADSKYASCCLLGESEKLSSDPVRAADEAVAAADAAMKAVKETSEDAKKIMGGSE